MSPKEYKDLFDRKIQSAYQSLNELLKRATGPGMEVSVAAEALEELATTVEELQAASDELSTQNEALAAARISAEAERRRYSELFEFAPDGYLVTDCEGIILEANLAAAAQLHVSIKWLVGKPLAVFVADEDRMEFRSRLNIVRELAPATAQNWRSTLQPRENEAITASITAGPAYDLKNNLIGLRWLIRDVTARKKDEEELEKHRQHLEELVQERTSELVTTNKRLQAEMAGREKVQRELKQARNLLEEVTAGTDVIIAAVDSNLRFTFFNMAYKDEIERHTGKELNTGMYLAELYTDMPEQLEITAQEWSHPLQGESSNKTIVFGDPGRYRRYYNVLLTPIWDDNGHVVGAGEVAYDVTKQVQAEEALRESEEHYRSLFNSMTEGFGLHEILLDEKGVACDYRFLEVNPAFEALTGLQREAVVGKLKSQVEQLRGDDPKWVEMYGKVALTGEALHVENYSPVLKRHYEVYAYRPAPNQFAVIFMDITERKRMEQALKDSEAKANALIKYAPTGIYELDFRGPRFISINDAMCKILGYTREELFALGPSGLLDEDSRLRFADRIKQQLMGGNIEEAVEYRVRKKDGSVIDAILNVTLNPSGNEPNVALVVAYDISERKKTQSLVQANLQRFYRVLSSMNGSLLLVSEQGRVEFANQLFCDYFSLDCQPADLVDLTASEMIARIKNSYQQPEEQVARIKEIMEQGQAVKGEEIALQGGRTCLRDFIPLVVDGKDYGRAWYHLDITGRKLAEQVLQESEARFRQLADASFEGLVIHADGLIVDANAKLTELVGYEPSFLIGKTFWEFIEPKYHDLVREKVRKDSEATYEVELIHQDGQRIPVEVMGRSMQWKGQLVRVAALRDITQRRQQEQELRKRNRTLRALSNINQAMLHAVDEAGYMEDVCRIIVEDCGHAMTWIGFAEEDEGKSVRPVASAGFEEGYLETLKITWEDSEHGRGPTGTAIRTGQVSMCRNMLTDPQFEPWREQAVKRGYASSIVLPLKDGQNTFGSLTIYAREPDPFSEDETTLLSELAGDLAYGILTLRARNAHALVEEALQQSEARFRRLYEAGLTGVIFWDMDGRINDANDRFLEMTGYDRADLTAGRLDWAAMTPPEYRALDEASRKELAATGVNQKPFEKEYLRKDGRRVPVLLAGAMLDEARLNGVAMVMDISERKQAERALQESEEHFAKTFHSSPVGTNLFRMADGRSVDVNDAFLALTGYAREEVVGHTAAELNLLFNPEERAAWTRSLQEDGAVRDLEISIRQKSGQVRNALFSLAGIEVNGERMGLIQATDITERKQAEQELRERTQQLELVNTQLQAEIAERTKMEEALLDERSNLQMIFNAVNVGMLQLAADGSVRRSNQVITQWTGRDSINIQGLQPGDALGCIHTHEYNASCGNTPVCSECRLRNTFESAILSGEPIHDIEVESVLELEGGESHLWLDVSADPVSVSGERNVILAINNITARKEAENELRQARDELDVRVQQRTRDLNASNKKLKYEIEERQELADNLHDAVNQSLFSAGLIAEVLPRLWERDQVEARKSLTDLRQLTRAAQGEMRGLMAALSPTFVAANGLDYHFGQLSNAFTGRTNQPVVIKVSGETSLLAEVQLVFYRVCQEALNNIAKHARATKVEIDFKNEGGRVNMRITDDGCGYDTRTATGHHYGLEMMQERAASIGATLVINSQPGHGTQLSLKWTSTTN